MLFKKIEKESFFYNLIVICISLSFFIFVEYYEYYTYTAIKRKIEEYSRTLSFLVWNLDKTTSKDYLEIILKNNDYNKIEVLLEDQTTFLELKDNKIGFIENFLLKVNFIKIFNLQSNIEYQNKVIGYLKVDWINKNGYIYNYVLLILVLTLIVLYFYIRLAISKKEITKANQQLAIEIHNKNQALLEVQKLKQQQDGDYFLTSLLLIPLSANQGTNEQVNVEFFVKQKKNFKFKNYVREIGGDICISHIINLRNRKYTVCLNADSMGKSIQGAGGCLVLGSVFEAIIERTKLSSLMSQLLPERWLKNAFLELHKVFESFDGSMMASIFLCLIDNQTGLMYYMFAEHPFPVLYRNKEAIFLDENFMFYKLGVTLGQKNFLNVRTFQLQINDIIFVGSDGKDDIILGTNEKGENIINTDDSLFLRIVEESEGDLNSIYRNILKKGELLDDVSILKIEYKYNHLLYKINFVKNLLDFIKSKFYGNATELEKIIEDDIPLANKIAKIYNFFRIEIINLLKREQYQDAIYLLEQIVQIFPDRVDFIFYLSYAYYKNNEFSKALDYAESLRLRNVKDKRYLTLLAKIYYKIQNKSRLDEILNVIFDFYPYESFAKKLKDKLQMV